jgi:hypothetical protein
MMFVRGGRRSFAGLHDDAPAGLVAAAAIAGLTALGGGCGLDDGGDGGSDAGRHCDGVVEVGSGEIVSPKSITAAAVSLTGSYVLSCQ